MTLEVPQWVRLACQRWGRQKRRIWSGAGEWYVTSEGIRRRHVDGYAESFLARVQDEKVGAGSSPEVRQRWPEVYFGEGLEVQRAIPGMPEVPFRAIHLRYVWDAEFALTARQKAELINLPLRSFCEAANLGETWIWSRLDAKTACVPEWPVAHVVESKLNRVLPSLPAKHTVARNPSRMAELSLKALQRPTLARRR